MKGKEIPVKVKDEFSVESTIILRKQDAPYRNIEVMKGTLIHVSATKLVKMGERKRVVAEIKTKKIGTEEMKFQVLVSDLAKLLTANQIKKSTPMVIAAK